MKNLAGKCRLQEILDSRKMTQSELARRLKTTPQQIQHYVKNTRMMSLTTAKKISIILECDLNDLYDWHYL